MWAIGFIVAPTLFNMIEERALAGAIAGRLFSIISYIGLFSGGFLLLTLLIQHAAASWRQWRAWVLVVMLMLICVSEFYLRPQMAILRDGGLLDSEQSRFGMLHGVSTGLYLVNSLAGLVLVIFGVRRHAI